MATFEANVGLTADQPIRAALDETFSTRSRAACPIAERRDGVSIGDRRWLGAASQPRWPSSIGSRAAGPERV
jgi:hypothetical protein